MAYTIVRRDTPTMYFIGVTTGQSMMARLFPLWAGILRLEGVRLVGVDLPLHAPAEQYRQAVAQIKYDPLSLGALITTHKIDLMNAAGDLFDGFDRYAQLCGEVSCISKRDGQLIGYAKDPLTSRLALQAIIAPGYWGKTGAHVLCLGGGGSGTAITVNLLTQPDLADRPARIIVVNRSQPGLEKLRAIVAQLKTTGEVEYILNENPHKNDELMATLPPGSLVINATGMGKDRPGSPVTDAGLFPMNGIAWELNYRGALAFLQQARAQEQQRRLYIHDGWHYFIVSWADHIAEVFHIKITPEQLAQLTEHANALRGGGG
ncbi:MAG: shikimate dehydrogenase [Ktedonobacteraceae bacterium]|nr:shikimate dehydrogenase [Ktedonobacteraceae bacterium]